MQPCSNAWPPPRRAGPRSHRGPERGVSGQDSPEGVGELWEGTLRGGSLCRGSSAPSYWRGAPMGLSGGRSSAGGLSRGISPGHQRRRRQRQALRGLARGGIRRSPAAVRRARSGGRRSWRARGSDPESRKQDLSPRHPPGEPFEKSAPRLSETRGQEIPSVHPGKPAKSRLVAQLLVRGRLSYGPSSTAAPRAMALAGAGGSAWPRGPARRVGGREEEV